MADGDEPGDEAAAFDVLDRQVTAISETHLEAQAAMQTPDGTTRDHAPRGALRATGIEDGRAPL